MTSSSNCPKCNSVNIYQDGNLWICPECSYEWSSFSSAGSETVQSEEDQSIKDAYGNILNDGDSITVIKELRIRGSSSVVKVGSKAKNIKLVDSSDGHNISCKIDGIGSINLKSEFVKKA